VSGLILCDLATGPGSTLTPPQRLVALCLGHFMGGEPDCSPSLGALSEWTGLSVATVKRALDVLTAPDGFLEKVPGVGRYASPTYRLRPDRATRGEPAHRESERATAPKTMAPTKKGPSPASASPKQGAVTVVMSQAPSSTCPDCGGAVEPADADGIYRCSDDDLGCTWSARVEAASHVR
jgi:hypothetical protein